MKRAFAVHSIDDYIAQFPEEVQTRLEAIRALIRKEVPEAEEAMKYQIPTFVWHGNLVHFAAFKNHIGFYPPLLASKRFKKRYPNTRSARDPFSFLWKNRSRWD